MKARNRTIVTGTIGFVLGTLVTTALVRGQGAPTKLAGEFGHVAMVVSDVEESARTFADIFGVSVPPPRVIKNIPFPPGSPNAGKTMGTKTTFLQANGMNLELIEPLDGPSPWRDFLEKNGEGVHHIAFTVPEWAPMVKFLESKGGTWVQGTEEFDFGYVDLTQQLGFTVEVMGPNVNLPAQ
jgi:catechol 2,3-dioxygenase-like lactoylglutathione lyase family enzyme